MNRESQIFHLRNSEKKTYEEIGNIFHISRQRIHQILKNYKSLDVDVSKKLRKNECELCGLKNNLELHHIDQNTKNNSMDNLVTACSKCHKQLDKLSREKLNKGVDLLPKKVIPKKKNNSPAAKLARRRWAKTTKEERSKHGKLMVKAREAKKLEHGQKAMFIR